MTRDEQLIAWAKAATKGLRESAVFINLWDAKMHNDPFDDPMPLIQMGYSIFLDKPIVVLAPRGAELPSHLVRCADVVEYYDRSDQESMEAAIRSAFRQLDIDPDNPKAALSG